MKDKKKQGIGLRFALNGLVEAVRRERNFRIHLIFAVIAISFSFIFNLSIFEWLIIIFVIQTVLVAELTNSVIERLIDYLKPEINEYAKIIKDMGAAIVLITAITSIIVGTIIFIPKILSIFL